MIDLNTTKPVTYNQYVDYYRDTSHEGLVTDYNQYLVDWKNRKEINKNLDNNYRANTYKEFLKNINTSNLPKDVQIFLQRLDYDDIYELDLASHYFSLIITEEIKGLKDQRNDVRFNPIKNNLKASPKGIEKYLKAHILSLLKQPGFLSEVDGLTFTENETVASEYFKRMKISFTQYVTDDLSKNYNTRTLRPDYIGRVSKKAQVKNLSKKTIQLLSVNGKYLYTSAGKKLSINNSYTDWNRLPERFFVNEIKKEENLITEYYNKIKDKYLGTDSFLLSGNGVKFSLQQLYKSENSSSYSYNYYNPEVSYEYGRRIRKDLLCQQLSFGNAGLGVALSKNLTFNVDVSAAVGLFYIPDPAKIQPGKTFYENKFYAPINYNADNSWIKTYEVNSIKVRDNNSLKGTGYQSREASLKYTPTGINKVSDEYSFWSGSDQLVWKNKDAYPRYNMNLYPEEERFNDLLINNYTGVQVKNDVYGNEFILLKATNPKRYNTGSVASRSSSYTPETPFHEIYDGLYFDAGLQVIKDTDNTLYPELTSVFDTLLFNDNSGCYADEQGTADANGFKSFFAPLSAESQTQGCEVVSGDDLVDGGPFSNNPVKASSYTLSNYNKITIPQYSNDIIIGPYTTVYQNNNTNNPTSSRTPVYDETFVTPGSAYVRDVYDQKIYPLYEKLSGALLKIPDTHLSAVSANKITGLDIVGSTIFIQTVSATYTEKYTYEDGVFSIEKPARALIVRT